MNIVHTQYHEPRLTTAAAISLQKAVRDCRFFDCTLWRRPKGGWYVAPMSGGPAFIASMTRFAMSLEDAVYAADRIDRKRTGRGL